MIFYKNGGQQDNHMRVEISVRHFLCFILLFLVEVYIGKYVKDSFVRPYLGDVLVVILLYCLVRSFLHVEDRNLIIGVFTFACFVEFTQYIHLIRILGLEHSKVVSAIMGTSFAWNDILCYLAGCLIVYFASLYFHWRSLNANVDL